MTERKPNPLLNLADMMVEDILGMTDEEILSEASPEQIEEARKVRQEVEALLDRWTLDALGECAPPTKETK